MYEASTRDPQLAPDYASAIARDGAAVATRDETLERAFIAPQLYNRSAELIQNCDIIPIC